MAAKKHRNEIAKALGASRIAEVKARPVQSAVDLLALRADVFGRIRSQGGRPTDPTWEISRQVPFSSETWQHLKLIADEIGRHGRKVAPAQIAALLIERALRKLEVEDIRKELADSKG